MSPMGFTPRKSVVLRTDDGVEVVARPFFYMDQSGSGIKVELFTDDGMRLGAVRQPRPFPMLRRRVRQQKNVML
jgi:hypothetical protein